MNSERLYTIAVRLVLDLTDSDAITALNALNRALRSQMSSPSAENTAAIETRLEAVQALVGQERFHYPETWNSALLHIGALELKDGNFAAAAVNAVRGNSITLESAASAVTDIHDRLTALKGSLSSISEAFGSLGIDAYELDEGEAELSVLIPRSAFRNELKLFAKDITEITKFLELAEEIATGSRTPPKLDELSTTDPIIIAGLTAPACLFVLKVVKDIVEIIKSTYELREARAKALAAEASNKTLKSIDEDIMERIDTRLKSIVDGYFKSPRGRSAELKVELTKFLPKLAARLDNGYRIEGAAGEPDSAGDGERAAGDTRAINVVSREISYTKLPETPVLSVTYSLSQDDDSTVEAKDE